MKKAKQHKDYQAAHFALDTKGNISLPFNTKGMYRASKSTNQATYIGIFKDD
jgi:isoaspartyl peptidase/L-asparaginase-like protein (Ntn-hydrolase superfamily)